MKDLFANGNLESGFIDRILFTVKLTENSVLRSEGIPENCSANYNQSIKNLLNYKKQSENPDEVRKQFQISFTTEAEKMLFKYVQKLIDDQKVAKPIIKEYGVSTFDVTIFISL